MNVLPLDEKRRQFLEARLEAGTVENGVITSPAAHSNHGTNASTAATQIDTITSPKEVINIDSSSCGSGSRSNSRLSLKENRTTGNGQNDRETAVKRPLEFASSDSFDAIRDDKSIKVKRTEPVDIDSPEPEKPVAAADSGSRGATAKNTIRNYFVSEKDGGASFNHINTGAATTKDVKDFKESKDGIVVKAEPGATAETASGAMPPPSKTAPAAKTVVNAQQQQVGTILELKKQIDQLRLGKEIAETRVQGLEEEKRKLAEQNTELAGKIGRLTRSLEEVHRTLAMQEFRRRREKLALDNVRLGKVVSSRASIHNHHQGSDFWDGGYRKGEIERQKALLKERKEELEARRKRVQNLRRAAKKGAPSMDNLAGDASSAYNVVTQDGFGAALVGGALGGALGAAGGALAAAGAGSAERDRDIMDNDMDLNTETEVIRIHLEQLKKDELALAEEERQFSSERAVHHKEMKRIHCEESSEIYKDELRVMHNRYLPQCLLGKGGFSEVWKCLDLVELREVAVKVHQLNNQWSEERKHSYIRHVTREYTIHRDMKHPRVVQLFDVFELGLNAFATVLEYCKGIDLDEKLKRQKTIPEKDAKAIFMQIMSGLRYLDRPLSYGTTTSAAGGACASGPGTANGVREDGRYFDADEDGHGNNNNHHGGGGGGGGSSKSNKKFSIIHYDLKPANILFDEIGDVKITDFGLSKIIDDTNEGTSLELTSQGAGTYWYLPPECFVKGDSARISSKVDVWSAGIIFYQMLYGCRPYGEGQTQERVWADGIIANAGEVLFPAVPKISDEAKELIRACLTRDPRLRPDVVAVCQHPYMGK